MTTKDGLAFEAIAKKLLNNLNSEIPLNFHNGTQQEGYDSDLEDITMALQQAYAEGLKKSVVAKVPSEESFVEKFIAIFDFNNGSYEQDASTMYEWLLSQIKAVELKMPERRKYRCVQDNNELYGREDIAHDNGTVEGWNAHDDAVRQMNPELFGEIKK